MNDGVLLGGGGGIGDDTPMRALLMIILLVICCGAAAVPVETIPSTMPGTAPAATAPAVVLGGPPAGALDPSDDFSPGLGLFALGVALIFLVAVVVIAAVFCLLVAAGLLLLLVGVLSTSIIVGLARRSAGAGFRTAFTLLGAVGMMVVMPVVSSIAVKVMLGHVPGWVPLVGGVIGIPAGALLGYCVAVLLGRILGAMVERFRRRRDPTRHVRDHFPVEQ